MTATATARGVRLAAAAAEIGVSTRTLQRQIAAGNVRAYRIGRALRVPVSEIDRLTGTPAAGEGEDGGRR